MTPQDSAAAPGEPARPSVAVVVPVFDGARTLRDCLASVVGQTHAPSEIIVVDDCSTDGSAELVEHTFPEVTVIRLPRNSGVGYARNTGVAAASSDLVAFLDQDDLWLPVRCERLADHFVRHPGSDAVVTDAHVFAAAGERDSLEGHPFRPLIKHWVLDDGAAGLARELSAGPVQPDAVPVSLSRLLNWTVAVTTTYAIRRSAYLAVGGCATWLRSADDWILLQTLAGHGEVHELDDRSVLYRVHGSNTSIGTDWGLPLLAAAVAVRQGRNLVTRDQSRDAAAVGRLSESGFLMNLLVGVARSPSARTSRDLAALVALLATDGRDHRVLVRQLARVRLGAVARRWTGRARTA